MEDEKQRVWRKDCKVDVVEKGWEVQKKEEDGLLRNSSSSSTSSLLAAFEVLMWL